MCNNPGKTLIFFVIILCVNFPVGVMADIEYKKVENDQFKDILLTISDTTRDNYDKIRTWQGTASLEISDIYYDEHAVEKMKEYVKEDTADNPKKLKKVSQGDNQFKLDLVNDRIYKIMNRSKPIWFQNIDSGRIYNMKPDIIEMVTIKTPSKRVQSGIISKTKDGVVLEKRAEKYSSPNSPYGGKEFDPREFFYIGLPVQELLSKHSQVIGKDGFGTVIEEGESADGLVYRVKLSYFDSIKLEYIITFSKNAGFNPVYAEVYENDLLCSKITTKFDKIDGIYVPVDRYQLNYDKADGRLREERKVTFSGVKINKTILEETFSDENCGLREGEKLIDHTNNKKEFILKAGKFVEVADANK
jgi:hypothetical protein